MNLLQICYDFSYQLATNFYGFKYGIDLSHMTCHVSIFVTLALSCVCVRSPKTYVWHAMSASVTEHWQEGPKVWTKNIRRINLWRKFFEGLKVNITIFMRIKNIFNPRKYSWFWFIVYFIIWFLYGYNIEHCWTWS